MIRRLSLTLVGLVAALQMMSNVAHAGVDCYADMSGARNVTGTDVGGVLTVQVDGFQLGLGGGCDLGVDKMLFGVWGRYDFTDVSNAVLNADDYWSFGGRVGYKITEGVVLYGSLGFARSDISILTNDAARDGIVYGPGLEISLDGFGMPNVSGYVAWEHIDWRDKGTFDSDSDVIRTGVRIRFNVLK